MKTQEKTATYKPQRPREKSTLMIPPSAIGRFRTQLSASIPRNILQEGGLVEQQGVLVDGPGQGWGSHMGELMLEGGLAEGT